MSRPVGWWRRKSTPAKVETYTRWSFHSIAALEALTVGLMIPSAVGGELAVLLVLTGWVHALFCGLTGSRALDWTRGRRPQPARLLWVLAALTLVIAIGAMAIAERGPRGEDVDVAASGLYGSVLVFGAGFLALGVRDRRRVLALVVGFTVGSVLLAFLMGRPGAAALFAGLSVLIGAGVLTLSAVFSVWLIDAVFELDAARETRARLAVAEERLRFGRDLHDVIGRNLAVIALKSELAVQLTRRGRKEAVEQMVEVQRIARESQREVRDVVRGYREADLGVELTGAQGVLTAAGIDCEVTGEAVGLPLDVQSALGWVVREATTNVLRHGDAKRCTVAVRVSAGRVVLTVENDGASRSTGVSGSGLTGLRERLSAVDGTLEAGRLTEGVFRLVAEIPTEVAS
ncbi:sensor histidine kinase [Streptomyces fulvoviolaceus]|uniref:sensor histidine kinase n=1 Tax=Streptomyces fulvoviolaceus TaxID=285535 RepID=UPI0004C9E6C2|nr:histidine kinase [Streptomyces fulvoviolaceus]